MSDETETKLDFIRTIVDDDIKSGKHDQIVTRFPPEPNGYLHIGHAKAICLSFGIRDEFADVAPNGTKVHLRFDDTNPVKEEQEYIDSIKKDVRWLGFDWNELYFASDYFGQLYEWAKLLIANGKAYVDDQDAEQMRLGRGTLTAPGTDSPFRDRPAEESLDLFERMKAGEFPDGSRVLRAKIDMASPNLNMRDPVMYRILHAEHPRTGDVWCIYPMYDYAHGESDWIEGITHSLCTLEFEDHRPLYNWFVEQIQACGGKPAGPPVVDYPPRQIEFSRLNVNYTVMSKRKFLQLVNDHHVNGWDDPRMPTLSGMRRRGYTPEAIRAFVAKTGVTKFNSVSEIALLEHFLRNDLNKRALRVMGVLRPLKLLVTNYPEGQVEEMDAINNPEDEGAGKRKVPFSRELYIEQSDFMEDPPKKFFRLGPGREVRLRYGYWVTCTDFVKNDDGEVVEVHCTYDPETKGGNSPPDGRKVKGTIHWVSAQHALDAEVRLYDHLFKNENPYEVEEGGDPGTWLDNLNPESLEVLAGCKVERSLADAAAGTPYQFERTGYFCVDSGDSSVDGLVFNRTVGLRDTWAKINKKKK